MKNRMGIGLALMLVVTVVLTACSGSGGDGGSTPGPGPKPVLSSGIMAKGSVIVNGVRFEDTAANITGDDTAKTLVDLKDGMVVKVKGTRNDDGVTGTAQRIEIENEVRGTVTSVGTGSFSVLGQTVIVSSTTVTAGGWTFDPATGLISGLTGTVEVHGARNTAGDILASRVEMIGTAVVDELRGIVTGLTPTPFSAGASTFSIGALTISTSASTTVLPIGATVQEGTLVEVHLAGTVATRIEVEDAEDAEFEPSEGQEVEIEGYVANYDNISDFEISGVHVHTTGSTKYVDGIFADLANDAKVEVEGHMSAGILVADKVKFKDDIRIEANVTSTGPLVVLGLTVYTTADTEIIGGAPAISDGVKLRGYLNSDGSTITATRIEKQGSVAADKNILQGPVSDKNEGLKTLTIAGINVSLSAVPAHEIKDDNDTIISLSTFYASITLNRTAVKVRGTAGAPFAADKAEIE